MKLDRPLSFFDLETTGTDVANDKIVSIAVSKFLPDGSVIEKYMLLNPGIPIPAEATAVHGLTDEMVKDAPLFKQISRSLYNFLSDTDLGGYNISRFDVPLLCEEFMRCEIPFFELGFKVVDPYVIFVRKEERNLSAAVKFYCDEDMEGAHDATADNLATLKVFRAQIERYPDLAEKSLEELDEFCADDKVRVDPAGNFVVDEEGDIIFARGKHKGDKCSEQMGYLKWMIGAKDNKTGKPVYPATTIFVANKIYTGNL